MHVTAHDPTPLVVQSADLDEAMVANEREIFASQAAGSGKPPEIIEKIVDGKVRKFLAEVSLVDQEFVMILARLRKDDLAILGDLMQAGKVTPVIDRRYSLSEVPAAMRYSEEGHARGKIVIGLE